MKVRLWSVAACALAAGFILGALYGASSGISADGGAGLLGSALGAGLAAAAAIFTLDWDRRRKIADSRRRAISLFTSAQRMLEAVPHLFEQGQPELASTGLRVSNTHFEGARRFLEANFGADHWMDQAYLFVATQTPNLLAEAADFSRADAPVAAKAAEMGLEAIAGALMRLQGRAPESLYSDEQKRALNSAAAAATGARAARQRRTTTLPD